MQQYSLTRRTETRSCKHHERPKRLLEGMEESGSEALMIKGGLLLPGSSGLQCYWPRETTYICLLKFLCVTLATQIVTYKADSRNYPLTEVRYSGLPFRSRLVFLVCYM